MHAFAMTNQKGGVGKSTATANLGYCLGSLGQRVLLVDLDPQGNLTDFLGVDSENQDLTIYDAMFQDVDINKVIIKSVKPNVDLAPANLELANSEIDLMAAMSREHVLKGVLDKISSSYDFIIIDCAPSLGFLTINALVVADEVLIPVSSKFPSTKGIRQLLRTIDLVQQKINPEIKIGGVILTMHDNRTIHAQEILQRIRDYFGESVYKSVIPVTVRFDEATTAGKTIVEYEPDSKASKEYKALAKEVLNVKQKVLSA